MEANEFYNISIAPLVSSSFSLEWSEDNHVSVITQRGVHVFELIPHPTCIYPTLKFWRTFVYASEFLPAENFSSYANDALWKMDREKIYELLLQEAITPKIDDKTEINSRIAKVAWSPKKLANSSKCLAAIMTSAGSVEILYESGMNWFSMWNLSSSWSKIVQADSGIDPSNLKKNSFADVPWSEHVKRLLGTSIDWSPIFRDSNDAPFANLVIAHRSSDITIFRIERISNVAQTREPTLMLKKSFKTSVKIAQLMWIPIVEGGDKNLIMIGWTDGKIDGLVVNRLGDEFNDEKIIEYETRADRMAVTSFRYVKINDGHFRIIASKNSCLVVFDVNDNCECLRTKYLRLVGFSITGLTMISDNRVLATTQDARMYIVDIVGMNYERVQSDLKSSKVQYLGTARSPNGTIFLNITSPDGLYDHLITREPSTLQIFRLSSLSLNPWTIIEEKIKLNVSLNDYWDCLEALRLNAAKSSMPMEKLPKIPQDLDSMGIHELRIVMWLTMITQVLDKKFMLKGVDRIVGEISEAQPMIFLQSAARHLIILSRKDNNTEDEKRCANYLRMYMEIYIAGDDDDDDDDDGTRMNETSRQVRDALEQSSKFDVIHTETCNLCDEILDQLPWCVDRCPSGHKLPRCSLTLLQITSVDYRSCPSCGRLFHSTLDEYYDEVRCLYCDIPAIYDNRVRSYDLGDKEEILTNLSKRPASYVPETRLASELDNNVEKVGKKRGLNPHTFAVIVNGDQDDDSMITETWQEF